nr:kallikrein-15-like isoform X2 [Monopterus albus]
MLIRLNDDVKSPTINLPPVECTRPEMSHQVQIGGLGFKADSGKKAKAPSKLQCSSTDIKECGEDDKPDAKYFSDETTTMCAFKPGVEVCFGDSGSGVEYNNLLYGIILNNPDDKCSGRLVMLDICKYRKWIDETMEKN